MTILVFGRTGQVATELIRSAARRGVDMTALGRDRADLGDPATCAAAIASVVPDVVINAAAYTAVDAAETDADMARLINAAAPSAMARACASAEVPFLHISTDYVFDGSSTRTWVEDDPTGPLGIYGATKLEAEERIAATGGAHVILRTAWVFSAHGKNFVKTMLRLGAERDSLSVVDDQRGGPTPAADIADALLDIAAAFRAGHGHSGVFHFAGAPAASWADFAEAIFDMAGMSPKLMRIPTSAYPTLAIRPANSVLDCRKIAADYGIAQPDWRIGLAAVIRELEAGA
jgi:dTDP-4-dehydrorhamnose reductase